MKGKAKAAIMGVAVVIAFLFLVPIVQVGFSSSVLSPASCSNSSGQLTSLCTSVLMHGYGSITFWLFGAGGLYATQYRMIF